MLNVCDLKDFRMKKTAENFAGKRNRAFTLIELLVVIAIIAMLLAILVPGMHKLKMVSRKLSQKSLFHAIDISLELFKTDFEGYPDSERTPVAGGKYYCGAQHLAEAMLGRDEKGYEPIQDGKWTEPGQEPYGDVDYNLYWSSDKSLNRRKKTYIDLKDTGAYDPAEIYVDTVGVYSDTGGTAPPGAELSLRGPVFTDVFLKKKIELANGETVKIGSPILYFKANTASRKFRKDGPVAGDKTRSWIYNYEDNEPFFNLVPINADAQVTHLMDEKLFYNTITDPKISFDKPFNANSFILMSAGDDAVFGTKDDVMNFNY